jgi:hypothetical protein
LGGRLMVVFIDLESTVIDTWDNGNLYHKGIRQIKEHLSDYDIKEVFVFSYAIYDDIDKKEFVNEFKPRLENVLNVKVNAPWSIEDFRKIAAHKLKCRMTQEDFFDFMKKDIMFPIFVEHIHKSFDDVDYVLFDDMVENTMTMMKDYSIYLKTV